MTDTFWGLLIPFLGTSLGAACVFFMQGEMNRGVQRGLTGFASGVMVAASIWSLLIPALDECEAMGRWAFLPPVVGFGIGMAFLLLLDHAIPHLHMNAREAEGPKSHLARTTMLVLAVTLHNIPEGIAVSVPIYQATGNKKKAFWLSFLSGMAEPVGALFGFLILLPFWTPAINGFILAAVSGIMVFISIDELLPSAQKYGEHHLSISGLVGGMVIMALSLFLFI